MLLCYIYPQLEHVGHILFPLTQHSNTIYFHPLSNQLRPSNVNFALSEPIQQPFVIEHTFLPRPRSQTELVNRLRPPEHHVPQGEKHQDLLEPRMPSRGRRSLRRHRLQTRSRGRHHVLQTLAYLYHEHRDEVPEMSA